MLSWPARRVLLAAVLVFAGAILLYLPTVRNQFVWDDIALIENQDIRTLDAATMKRIFTTNFWEASETHSGLYRPLTALSFHADYQIHGQSPGGFHFTNAVLNGIVCALVFLTLLEMFARPDLALVAAALFAAFPMHTENVAWVAGRTDVIAALFMLASLWCYARWRSRPGVHLLAGIVAGFILALLGKETAVVLPAVIAAANLVALPRDRAGARRWALVVGLLIVTAGYFFLRRAVLGSAVLYFSRFTTGALQAVSLSLSILAHYTYKLIWPFRLDAEADFLPPKTFLNIHTLAGLLILVAAVYAVFRWRRHAAVVFGLALIALGLAPVLNILPVNQVLAERFLYFPSLGYVLLLGLALSSLRVRRPMATTVAVAALVTAFAARTVARTFDWKDELTLFEKTVATSGDNARARANLGASLYKQGRFEEAYREFGRATELNPSYAPGWSGRARAAVELGRGDDAMESIQRAVQLDPNDALLYHHLGVIQFKAGRYADAAQSFRRALELRPRHLHARFNLALALYQQRDFEGAAREFTLLENKDTDFVNAWFFLAECELQRGNQAAAAQAAAHFLTLHRTDDALAARAREIAAPK